MERATILVAIVAVVVAVFMALCCFSHLSCRILQLFGIPKSPKIGAGVMITFDQTEKLNLEHEPKIDLNPLIRPL